MVHDPTGAPIAGAVISISGMNSETTTNEDGEFQLTSLTTQTLELRARRLGFIPATTVVTVPANGDASVSVQMTPIITDLAPVVVKATITAFKGRLAGYYQRLQRRSSGHFITREEIDKRTSMPLSQLLRSVPGINAFPLKAGGAAVRIRGRGCRPLVWLDGVPLPAGEVDLDAFPVNTLHGIEVYSGSTNTPSDYVANDGLSSCGSILLWSRGRDTDPPVKRRVQSASLDDLLRSSSVYVADQVDRAAELQSETLAVEYPAELFASHEDGAVLAEFVADTSGNVERNTLSIVSSTHPLLAIEVARALISARYTPAVKDGKPVRQVIQQRFVFRLSDKTAQAK